jgi:hypothetical protein
VCRPGDDAEFVAALSQHAFGPVHAIGAAAACKFGVRADEQEKASGTANRRQPARHTATIRSAEVAINDRRSVGQTACGGDRVGRPLRIGEKIERGY